MTIPSLLLRLEGAAILLAATALYWHSGNSWWLFALLIFAPDLSMLGYLAGSRIGAMTYNLLHTLTPAVTFAALGVLLDHHWIAAVGLIWLAHIGFDRLLGYGLKYPEGFKATHLARV
ncbi:MAG TPA: DUF4260 domain-containing protein [Thermomicrobiales bacterium]|nr:DUF4260 domain-containing protein [Thermomicrobiales bacterium]